MTKAIMIADKPIWCAKIMNGDKTIEVRKNKALAKAIQKLIDEYGYADIYVYCSKGKRNNEDLAYCTDTNKWQLWYSSVMKRNGKVVFKFRCYKVVPIVMQMGATYGYGNNGYIGYGHCEKDNFKFMFDMEKETCLEHNEELCKYLNNGKNFDDIYINKLKANDGYAIHINNLEIFDKPKELSEFKRCTEKTCIYGKCHKYMHCLKPLTNAPQNFVYIESEE